jgi:Ca2+-binding RTX toxin-like protein
MSSILIDFLSTEPASATYDDLGGLSIEGREDDFNRFFIAGNGDDDATGGSLADFIRSGLGDDTLKGKEGDDTLRGGRGNDLIFGGRGNDLLKGGQGDDSIAGNAGDDTLNGGKGSDLLMGGQGADTFEFLGQDLQAGAIDQIIDFTKGEDKISIQGVSSVEYDSVTGTIKVNGQDVINITPGTDLTIKPNGNDFELF